MLEPIVRARQYGAPFVPNDLLVMKEADPQQAIENFPGVFRSVPHVGRLNTRDERERVGPVGARVTGDRSLIVTFVRFFM